MKIRLQKFISQAGYCSRRQSEDLIRQGRVKIDGQPAKLGDKVELNGEIEIDGREVRLTSRKIYIKFNKLAGYTCTHRQFKKEKNIFQLVRLKEKLLIVGRLDKDSRGLVLLTNDGELAQKIAHPSYKCEKEYWVKIKNYESKIKNMEIKNIVDKFKQGIDIGEGDGLVRAKDARYLDKNRFKIILTQGKKRQIRRMFGKLGYQVEDLVRIRIGNLKLADLKDGQWSYLTGQEINNLP